MNENQNEYVDINAHDNYPDSEQKIEIPTMKVIPLKKICMTIGELPTSYLETMTYYEMLIWFIEYLKNNIIPTVNNNAEAIQEVQSVVLALQNYINDYKDSIDSDVEELEEYMNNYFENLDVQEEINNKLDDMLEDGVLEQIIEQFLQLTSLICFDNVADMKLSPNLANGSYARTLGYYSANDGGKALYKITSTQSLTDYQEELNSNLYATLIYSDRVNIRQLGAKGDGETDDTNSILTAIALNKSLYFPKGTYLLSETITLVNDVNWKGDGKETIFNSIPISETNQNLIQPLFNFSNLNNIRLKGFSTNNSTFKIMPTLQSGENIKEVLKNRNIIIEDVTIDTNDINISEKTNWEGMFINTPAPDNYTRDFHDGKYSRYGIQIFNNSGYNAIDIDNRIYDGEGNFATIQDNSAFGIVDGVLSSAPAFFMDMHGERNAINIKNRTETSSASSSSNPDSVFQVGYQGHLAIGCSVYDETGASGVGTVKLKDSSPSIRFYDTNYPNNICMIREQNNQFQFLANGTLCSHYNSNHYHEYKKPLKIDDLVTTGGGLILGSTFASGSDYHVFVDSNGILRINRTATDTPQTAEAGYSVQVNKSGASTGRPNGLTNDWQSIGTMFFDTTLGKPIFWNGTGWVDATGTSV